MPDMSNQPVYIQFLSGTISPAMERRTYLYIAPKSMKLQTGDIIMVNLMCNGGVALAQVIGIPEQYRGPVCADCVVLGRVDLSSYAKQQKLEQKRHTLLQKIKDYLSEQDVLTIAYHIAPYDDRLRELVAQYDDISAQLGKTAD